MKSKWIIALLATLIFLVACGEKEEDVAAKNMEQIYREEGIPVETLEMKPETFSLILPYSATLTDLRQSNATAMIGGRIEQVNVKVGDYVEQDQVVVEFPEDVPSAQYQQALAAYKMAESTYQRLQNLFEIGGISQQDLEGAETQYKVAAANLDAAEQMLKVRAPISGYVTAVNVRETESVRAETALVTVSSNARMKAKIWANDEEACLLNPGQKVTAIWNEVKLTGTVKEVATSKDIMKRAFGVDLEFDNSQQLCKSGVIGEILIEVYHNPEALLLPRKNVLQDAAGRYLYLEKNQQAVKQYVEIGHENSDFEIVSGLKIGDRVIVKGHNNVSDKQKVKVIAAN
ncbi:MAG: efflux RND transporter periplasmic adaptor subunit [Candidatus Cloacimonadales bacterium]